MKGVVTVLLVLVIAHSAVGRGQAETCGQIIYSIAPCLNFLVGSEPKPSDVCCSNVKMLKSSITDKEGMRSACKCLVAAASKIPNIKDENISSLPDKCGAPLPFPINMNMDCDKI